MQREITQPLLITVEETMANAAGAHKNIRAYPSRGLAGASFRASSAG